MSDKKSFEFYYKDIDNNSEPKKEVIESRGYKKAVKSFQNKYPKIPITLIQWSKNNATLSKEQKLPLGRKKKVGR